MHKHSKSTSDGKPGDLNFTCPDQEIAWNLPPKVQKLAPKKEI